MTRQPLTDSPWFWLAMFAVMGLAALVAIQGKYSQRQAEIEQKYQARERLQDVPDAAVEAPTRPMSTPESTLVPLWPVAIVLGAIFLVALILLVRSRRT